MNTPTPTLEEICKAHSKICSRNFHCRKKCPLARCHNEAKAFYYVSCHDVFMRDVLTGKRNLDGSLIATEKCDKLPDWVRSDALCVDKYGKVYRVHTVTAVNVYLDTLNGATRVEVPHSLFANGAYKQYDKKSALPSWCKVGQWCYLHNELVQITDIEEGIGVWTLSPTQEEPYLTDCTRTQEALKPVRFREYRTVGEAKHLLHKYSESDCDGGRGLYWIDRIFPHKDGKILINGYGFGFLTKLHTTVDGVPIGVPVVDDEAMKEVE